MSMVDNLKAIQTNGLRGFIAGEKSKWVCAGCGETICVHSPHCLRCGRKWR
jgi:hypothetical protein